MHQDKLEIESLDMEARGVGHLKNEDGTPGKVIFVDGALPGELVSYESFRRKSKWEAATLTEVHRQAALRVEPKCRFFGVCGGCAMQHVDPAAQVAIKQRVLEDSLWHIGKVKPVMVLRPIYGPTWNYRYRARLSVRNVRKKNTVLVGFREKRSPYVTDMSSCEILPPNVSALLVPLRGLIAALSIADQVPQLELAVGEGEHEKTTVLVLRHMAPLNEADQQLLIAFADRHRIEWWLQPQGPDSAWPFYPAVSDLHYRLPEFGIRMPFKPTDFTQINHQINRVLVARVVQLLDLQAHQRVADLFCGLGNFSLPLATRVRSVLGIEGSAALVERAHSNARLNGLAEKTSFVCRNLFELESADLVAWGKFDRLLVDPPRDGAAALCKALASLTDEQRQFKPTRIVYVSCNPATLARDAGILVHEAGYALRQAGVVNMFPHTAHVESIAVFELATGRNI